MSSTPREIGTLVVVILKAQHLPNKRHIGKQDPYCCVTLDGEKKRTRAIKRGGQHPEWDEEVRFALFEETEITPPPTRDGKGTPPPPPPKDSKKKKKVKGGNVMKVACYADDPKDPELIGEATVELAEVLSKGETDDWFTLMNKDKFSGEVYLELTFFSNGKPQEKKSRMNTIRPNKNYGGPGSFVPSEGESPSGKNGVPPSLLASSSLAKLDLYNPPYDTGRRQGSGSTVDRVADEFGGLTINTDGRRRESYPPPLRGHTPRPESQAGSWSTHSSSSYMSTYPSSEYSNANSQFAYDAPPTPTGRAPAHRHSLGGTPQGYPAYQSPYETNSSYSSGYASSHYAPSEYGGSQFSQSEYGGSMYSIPSASSGFTPVQTPAQTGFAPQQSGFVPVSTTPNPYGPPPSQTPVSFGYGPPQTPAPSGFAPPIHPSSSMGFHQPPPGQSYLPYQQYPPPPPSSAPPISYPPPGPPQSVPPASHSAPPHQYSTLPSPSHSSQSIASQQYPSYTPTTPSPPQQGSVHYNPSPPISGSRPLPTPGQQNGSAYPATPPHNVLSTSQSAYTNTPPHPYPLPTPPGPPQYPMTNPPQQNGFVPPPPPPPLNGSRLPGPPPPPPLNIQQQHSQPDGRNGHAQSPVRPPLPQPPTGTNGGYPPPPPPSHSQTGFQPPPPPPPLVPGLQQQNGQHPLPQPPQHQHSSGPTFPQAPAGPFKSVRPGEIFNPNPSPGPPPRPPAVYDSATGYWNAPQ